MTLQSWLVMGMLSAFAVGCGRDRAPDDRPPPLSERRELVSAPAVKLGPWEDCTSFGSAGCSSGLCFKTSPERTQGFRCSASCRSDADCGNLTCQQVYPSEKGWFCLPALPRDGGAP